MPADAEGRPEPPADADAAAAEPLGPGERAGAVPGPARRMTATARTATTPTATATGPTDGPRRPMSSRWACVRGGGAGDGSRRGVCQMDAPAVAGPRSSDRQRNAPSGRGTGRWIDALMADPTGFEPAISSVTGWHVGPLHHGSVAAQAEDSRWRSGCPTSGWPDPGGPPATYTPPRCTGSTSAPTPSPCRPTRCAGRWPRPRSATTSSATTPPSSRSRSGRPSCSARKPACSSRAGRRATSSPSWPTSPAARRRSRPPAATWSSTRPPATPSSSGRASGRCAERPDGTLDPATIDAAFRDPNDPHEPISGLVTLENTHAHSMGQPLGAAYTAQVAADRPPPRGAAPRRRGAVLQRGRRARRPAGRARRAGRLGHVLPEQGPRLPGRLGRRRRPRRSSGEPGGPASSSAAGCARSASWPRPASSPCATGRRG